MRKIIIAIVFLFVFLGITKSADAFVLPPETPTPTDIATSSAEASASALINQKIEQIKAEDITKPEEGAVRQEVLNLFKKRPTDTLTYTNFIEYFIQHSVESGVPANTVILILLVPLLASIVAFFRHVVGLPTIGMFVPVALAITLVATGLAAGGILITAIIMATIFSRIILKRIRIMQLPKSALSIFILSLFIIVTLSFSSAVGILTVRQLSIFPVLILILLSERIIALQLERSLGETILISTVTLFLGVLGFALLSSQMLQDTVLLYPETVLFLIPLNIAIGRYFGLRITEYFRFSTVKENGS